MLRHNRCRVSDNITATTLHKYALNRARVAMHKAVMECMCRYTDDNLDETCSSFPPMLADDDPALNENQDAWHVDWSLVEEPIYCNSRSALYTTRDRQFSGMMLGWPARYDGLIIPRMRQISCPTFVCFLFFLFFFFFTN